MILADSDTGLEYKLKCNGINAIIAEEPHYYEKIIDKIYAQINKTEETLRLYNEQNDLIDMSKSCSIFFSSADLNYQNTRFQKKFLAYLVGEIESGAIKEKLLQNRADMLCIMEEIRNVSAYEISYEDQFSIADIIKSIGIRLESPVGKFAEKFMDCAQTYRDFIGTNLFFLVGCAGFITEEEFSYLQSWGVYQEITCIFIEYSDCRIPSTAKKFIVDRDLCMIY